MNEPIRAGARSTALSVYGAAAGLEGEGETVKHGGRDANTPSASTA